MTRPDTRHEGLASVRAALATWATLAPTDYPAVIAEAERIRNLLPMGQRAEADALIQPVRQALQEHERKILTQVQKLLSVQGRTPEETAAYAQKAQDLMLAWNLSEDRLGEGGEDGRRAEEKFRGGFYEYERDLWERVADLNFCLYWSHWVTVPRERVDERVRNYRTRHAREFRRERQHRIVGRVVNITATRNMMSYLLDATERLCREWLGASQNTGLRSRRAVSFREGVASDLASRLWDRRQAQLTEERRAAERARREAEAAGMAGASSSTAITISSVRKSERDANMDLLYGEGWSARRAADIAKAAAAERAAREAYTRWAAANPEEAAREAEKERQAERRRSYRPTRERAEKERDWGAFSAGSEAGASISLDPQVGRRSSTALPAPRS